MSGVWAWFRQPAPQPPPAFLEAVGRCPVCGAETTFRSDDPWLRDHFACGACGCLPRERALVAVLERVRPDWRNERLHESSPSSRGSLKFRDEARSYTPTHYRPDVAPGEMDPTGAWRWEDLERQTFPDASFGVVVTQDVFEHLFRPDLAIVEIARTLSPGGIHICTIPLVRLHTPSRRRAVRAADGEVVHLEPREYHHNPVDPEGSLVTVDWGFDVAAYFQHTAGLRRQSSTSTTSAAASAPN